MTNDRHSGRSVLLIGPEPPPYGGMALQARLLHKLIERDGITATLLGSNAPFPARLRFLESLRGVRPFLRTLVFSWRLWRLLARHDVVHILACSWAYFFFIVYPAVLISRARRKHVILNYRGGDARRFFRWFHRVAAPVFKMADVVTTPSDFLAGIIQTRFQVPVTIVPNISNASMFRYRPRTLVRPRMLITRHLEKIYDVESALKAFRAVRQQHPDASLWIAGTGSQENHLRGLVAGWNLGNVRFLGAVTHEDLPAIYDQCDILLNASRIDNFPGALLEASAAGLVVVSTGAGGIPFIYRHGENALLVDPGDWQGLADSVCELLRSPALGPRLASEALALVRQYDWTNIRKLLYRVYEFPAGNAWDDAACSQSSGLAEIRN
jgi:glycosyltransferase involved in cell wall biosynthesis